MLCMFLSVLQQLPFKMAQITVLTKINTSPALLMSSIQGTDLLFFEICLFVHVVYVLVGTSVTSFEDDFVVVSN